MFADEEDGVDGDLIGAQSEGGADAFVDGDVVLVGQLQADVVLVDLVDEEGGDLGAGGDEAGVGGEAAEEFCY